MTSALRRASAVLVATIVGMGLSAGSASGAASAGPVLVIDGQGNGHGVGMSQDGALAMGQAGDGTATILDKFYPGTSVSTAGGLVGVRVLEGDTRRVDVELPGGGEVRGSSTDPRPTGFPIAVEPGGTVTLSVADCRFRAEARHRGQGESAMPPLRLIAHESGEQSAIDGMSTSTSTAVATTTTATSAEAAVTTTVAPDAPSMSEPSDAPVSPPDATAPARSTDASSDGGLVLVPAEGSTIVLPVRQRAYRGALEVGTSSMGGGLLLVNRLDVEDYLKGMGEVLDSSWPPAALQAQAVAARTYALRAVRTGGTICDDDRCQVYLGANVEYPAMNQAVDDTAGLVLTFAGGLASTVYSASAAGLTALPSEGFGTDDSAYPYLLSTPYPTPDPVPWTGSISLADLGALLDYPGEVSGAGVSTKGPSGRAVEVTLAGDAGPMAVGGLEFASRLDLQSTLFSLRTTEGASRRAAALPVGRPIQALPDEVAHLPPVASAAKPPRTGLRRVVTSAALLALAATAANESRRRRRR